MSQPLQDQATSGSSDALWVLVIDDDRLSSHSLSILLRFVGETPVMATSESWAESLRMLSGSGGSQLLAAAFGQIKKLAFSELLSAVHKAAPTLPLLLLGGSDSELEEALPQAQLATLPESLRARLLTPGDGALNNQRLLGVLNQARRLSGRAEHLQTSVLLSPTGSVLFRSLSGQSPSIVRVKQLLQQVATRPTSVLVRGESGTGKEIVARNLHYHSGRGAKPFIAVNCATIAPDQNGAELFGQERGADLRPGYIERADGGTLFLDEIGELPLNIQATLLRFLEDKQFQRIGGSEIRSADVRVVAGTRQNLEAKMREGRFREDLFYRLSVVPIELPPLRQRLEDIPELVKELISSLENRDQTSVRFNTQALQSLQKHSWPGNVRELANLVERLGIMHPNAVLGVSDLPPEYQYPVTDDAPEAPGVQDEPKTVGNLTLVQAKPAVVPAAPESGAMPPLNEARLQQYLDAFEKQLLEVALDDSGGMIDFAAERLQLDPASLRAMMQAHGIRERQRAE